MEKGKDMENNVQLVHSLSLGSFKRGLIFRQAFSKLALISAGATF